MASPDLSFFARGPDGLSLLLGPPFDKEPKVKIDRVPCTFARFSNDGKLLAVTSVDAVHIFDCITCLEIQKLEVVGVTATAFSPKGTYLLTFQRPSGNEQNLLLWHINTGTIVFSQFQKLMSKAHWPSIQFSEDETVACRLVTNEVHFFDVEDFSKGIVDRLRCPGVESASLATSPPSHIAVYVPELKGSPASVRIFERTQVSAAQPVARKSFFRSSSAQLIWNKGSSGLLVLAQSDVDKTNQSYYGETRLHYLTSNGSHEGTVPLNKEGPVHDVQWSPSGSEFLVIYGFMPSRATLFDVRCRPLFDFGTGPYNTIRWNPHGRFVCIAGFGNLPGDMAFWDRSSLKCIGNTRAECSVSSEWSADGRFFMTATTAPRLQIDNGIKIFNYDGSLYFERKYDKLFQAEWQPAPLGVYPDRPASPHVLKRQEERSQVASRGSGVSAATSKASAATSKPSAYRPPHAKTAALIRSQLLGEDDNPARSGGDVSKAALKNKKKREKLKEKKASEDAVTTETEVSKSDVEKQLGGPLPDLNGENKVSGDDVGKKLRALNKKLRQIEEIKQKTGGASTLSPAQQEKLSQEESLREEIKKLEALSL